MADKKHHKKARLEHLRQRMDEWRQFKHNLIDYTLKNPDKDLGDKDFNQWVKESESNIAILEQQIERQNTIESIWKVAPYAMIFLALALVFSFRSEITGYATGLQQQELSYVDYIGISYETSNQYNWAPENPGIITSVKISGLITGTGYARAYLSDLENMYSILDSRNAQLSNSQNFLPSEKNEDVVAGNNMTVRLKYYEDSIFDTDNNGLEYENSLVDFTVAGSAFDFPAQNENLCARWEIENVETGESSFDCYGSGECCSLLGLVSIEDAWNATYNVFKGKYVAGNDNMIRAQVVSVDTAIDEIHASEWAMLPARFMALQVSTFADECDETCSILLNKSSYFLIFELMNASINISNISYTIQGLENISVENISANLSNEIVVANLTIPSPIKLIELQGEDLSTCRDLREKYYRKYKVNKFKHIINEFQKLLDFREEVSARLGVNYSQYTLDMWSCAYFYRDGTHIETLQKYRREHGLIE